METSFGTLPLLKDHKVENESEYMCGRAQADNLEEEECNVARNHPKMIQYRLWISSSAEVPSPDKCHHRQNGPGRL